MSAENMCLVCKKEAIEFCGLPCLHPTLCKKCAMKQASGGKCKVCKQFFTELRRTNRKHDPRDEEDEEDDPPRNNAQDDDDEDEK